MSIYTALKFPIPVMGYCALHQVKKGTDPGEYKKTMSDFHKLLREESDRITSLWDTYRTEAQERAVQSARSALSQFLTTPLKSDDAEIRRILRDQILEFTKEAIPQQRYGMLRTEEGRVLTGHEPKGLTRKLFLSGKSYLKDLQFEIGQGHPEIFESVFIIEGGLNFDLIEHIVRDRIGIYTPVHGKHITEFDAYTYAAYNRILNSGTGQPGKGFEASLFFSKGSTRYAPFRNDLAKIVEAMSARAGISSVSAWQRKLGLGGGKEFVLRSCCGTLDSVHDMIEEIQAGKPGPAKEVLLAGSLLIKEFTI